MSPLDTGIIAVNLSPERNANMERTKGNGFELKIQIETGGTRFNYQLQVWVKDGRILRCGHPEAMGHMCCNARRFWGFTEREAHHEYTLPVSA